MKAPLFSLFILTFQDQFQNSCHRRIIQYIGSADYSFAIQSEMKSYLSSFLFGMVRNLCRRFSLA